MTLLSRGINLDVGGTIVDEGPCGVSCVCRHQLFSHGFELVMDTLVFKRSIFPKYELYTCSRIINVS